MIILIGGASCTGKTLMAQKILEKYHVPYLSIDHLKMGLIRGGIACNFTAADSVETIGKRLWPILKGVIMTSIENKQDLIVEGCYIPPDFINDFEEEYLRDITAVFILFSKNYIEDNFISRIQTYRNVIEQRIFEEDRSINQFISEHTELRKVCIENQVQYFEIEQDYETEICRVYDYIDSAQKAKR